MILFLLGLAAAQPEPVRGHVDWQGHPTMHQTWPLLFSKGLQDRTPRLSWRHQFQQTVHAPYLEASGVRIFLAAAMCAEKARDPIQARAMILEQFEFVEQFVAQHSDGFAMASTPAQARKILADTDKIVVVHSIEGGHHLLSDPEDAQFWAQRGVALITLMHLRDDELGGAALNPKWYGGRINPVGAKRQRTGERRGLTPRGREAIIELDAAGILVDFSHMAPDTVVDALGLTRDHGIPPVFTHGKLSRITDTEQGISDDQLIEVYRQGGHFALGLSALHLGAVGSEPPPDVCPETLEMFAYHHQVAHKLVLDHALELVGSDSPDDAGLTALSMGWSSDWNGWTNHSKPAYGDCRPRKDARFEIDTRGLAHPGLLPEHWERIALDGGDLDPMLRSAERFLQLWQSVMPTQPEQTERSGGTP